MNGINLDGTVFLNALKETEQRLSEKRKALNQINVFPVPDGDTGNNLLATIESALLKAEQAGTRVLSETAAAAWAGAREGSTGNSGAIFAQYLKGWSAVFAGLKEADAQAVSEAMAQGTQAAYNAVLKPAEGTILTVAREAAGAAKKAARIGETTGVLAAAYGQARKALLKTSRVLPELKDKKIVDAGGWGLLIFLRALLKVMDIPVKAEFDFKTKVNYFERYDYNFASPFDMEFTIALEADREGVLRLAIGEFGTELITQTNGNDCHVHIHTKNPLMVVQRVAELAEFSDLTVRDMRIQHRELADRNDKNYRTVAFGQSPGFIAMFAMAGAALAVSVNRLDKKKRLLKEYGADTLVLSCKEMELPFLKNGAVLLEDEARLLAALVSLYGQQKPGEDAVKKAAGYARNLEIVQLGYTFEARDGKKTVAKGGLKETLARAVAFLQPQSGEVLTMYYGQMSGRQEMETLLPWLQEEFDMLDGVELYYGGQVSPIIISIE